MSIHFRTLCEVEVEHGYYRGLCADIDFVVPGAEQALAAGVFGSPHVIIDGEAFFGADRLPQIERWLETGGF